MAPDRNPVTGLLPIMAVVAIAFLIIGLALPVLALDVHLGLGLNTFVVGALTGGQFLASLFSRAVFIATAIVSGGALMAARLVIAPAKGNPSS